MLSLRAALNLLCACTCVIGLAQSAPAAPSFSSDEPGKPYRIESADPELRGGLRVRHDFGRRFTAQLSDEEVHSLESRGFALHPVVLYQPHKPSRCEPWPQCNKTDDGGGDDGGGSDGGDSGGGRSALPDDPTPWGVEWIIQDPTAQATTGGAGVQVVVLDSGVQASHPDLVGRVAECFDFTVSTKSGRERKKPAQCQDSDGHGTMVAGIVAANGGDDGQGIYGIAPDASVLAYQVCGAEGCWADDVAAAIDFAGQREAQIVSISLGADQHSPLVIDAVRANPHMLYIAAAGNDGPTMGSIDYPGAHAEVVAVGAFDELFAVPDWSSRGSNDGDGNIAEGEVEFAAPGVRIESTWPDDGYQTLEGTSFSVPFVSGLAARLWTGDAAGTRNALRLVALDVAEAGVDPATGLGAPVLQDLPDSGGGGEGGDGGSGGDADSGGGGGSDPGSGVPQPNRLLTWTTATGPVATYQVEQKVGNCAWGIVGETSIPELEVALSSGVEYRWRVRALSADRAVGDPSGESAPYCHECSF